MIYVLIAAVFLLGLLVGEILGERQAFMDSFEEWVEREQESDPADVLDDSPQGTIVSGSLDEPQG